MKKWLLLIAVVLVSITTMSFTGSLKKLWSQYDASVKDGLPKTSIEILTEIQKKAKNKKDIGHYFKATYLKSQKNLDLGYIDSKKDIQELEEWIASVDSSSDKAILSALLFANYLNYYNSNYYRNSVRTNLSSEDSITNDIDLWTAKQFSDKITSLYNGIWADRKALLAKSAKDYIPFIEINEFGEYFNHDLYHVLYWYTMQNFQYIPYAPDWEKITISNLRKQALGDYSSNRKALLLLKLDEISNERAYYEDYENNDIEKVNQLINEFKDDEIVVEAVLVKSYMVLTQAEESVDYSALIAEINSYIKKYPKHRVVSELNQVINDIKKPVASFLFKRTAHTGENIIESFKYKNINKAEVKLYRWTNSQDIMSVLKNRSIANEGTINKEVLTNNTEFVDQLSVDGLYTEDHKTVKNDALKLSANVEGTYILSIESDKSERPAYTVIDIHNTAFVKITESSKIYDFITVDALSGYPVSDAQITITANANSETKPKEILASLKTDKAGRVTWSVPEKISTGERVKIDVIANNQRINDSLDNLYMRYRNADKYSGERTTHIITDRKIYRPGQTIYVKGYLYEQDEVTGNYRVLPNYKGKLVVSNNSLEIANIEVETNSFGSFTKEVVLPNSMLNGNVELEFSGRDFVGYQNVIVEEYKRPSFTMRLFPVEGLYKAGDKVVVKGRVESFSQSLLANARLEAEVSTFDYNGGGLISIPCRFIILRPTTLSVSVKDSLMIDKDGSFSLEIDTREDLSINYNVKVKLVVADGETGVKEMSLRVTKDSYTTRVSMPSVLDLNQPLDIKFDAFNLNGSAVDAKGQYDIYVANKRDIDKETKPLISGKFDTKEKINLALNKLPVGEYSLVYRGELESRDNRITFQTFSKKETTVPVSEGIWWYQEKLLFSEESPAVVYFGAAEKDVYAFVDLYSTDGKISSETVLLNSSYTKIEVPYKKEYKDGVSVIVSYYKNHRLYSRQTTLRLDAKAENLSLKWLTFRDHIKTGVKEEWTLQVLDDAGKAKTDVELLALMYDASLDELVSALFGTRGRDDKFQFSQARLPQVSIETPYRYNQWSDLIFKESIADEIVDIFKFDQFFFQHLELNYKLKRSRLQNMAQQSTRSFTGSVSPAVSVRGISAKTETSSELSEILVVEDSASPAPQGGSVSPQIRSNFNETAFFMPTLYTNKQGKVSISFTSPEQMTKWNIRVFAHTKDMVVGYSDKIAYTERKFAIQMNNPRFIRQGDKVLLSSTLKNDLPKALKSSVSLVLFDPKTDKQITKLQQKVAVGAHAEESVVFEIPQLNDREEVGVRIMADAGTQSDGEQYIIPVLSNVEPFITGKSIVVIDPGKTTIKLPTESEITKDNKAEVLVEFTSNPLWFTVTPILRTWTIESNSAISLSSKLAVGSVAYNLWKSNPEFIESFTKENAFKSFDSNSEFRTIQNQETPWLHMPKNQANALSKFHEEVVRNTSQIQVNAYLTSLQALQRNDGGFAWYEGMEANTYITFRVLQNLDVFMKDKNADASNVAKATEMAVLAFIYLSEKFFDVKTLDKLERPSVSQLELAIVGLNQANLSDKTTKAINKIADKLPVLLKEGSLLERSLALQLALLKGHKSIADKFAASLEEHLIDGKENGVHFAGREFDRLSLAYQLRIHTSAMQALYSWKKDQSRLNSMKFWLASAINNEYAYNEFEVGRAVSAIGMNVDADKKVDNSLTVELGKEKLILSGKSPYVKQTISIDGAMPDMILTKVGNQVVWGRVITKYYAKVTDVKSSKSDISVETKYYIERVVDSQKELKEINESTPLKTGDVIVSRVVFKLANDVDFVQITDSRAGNLEPVVTNSGYRWNALFRGLVGLPSYVSVRDASTQYFFYSLDKGTYVLENRSYVVRDGVYQTGTVNIQSAYSPELSGYSGSAIIKSGK